MHDSVTIGCYNDSLGAFRNGYAVVAVDVIRATTSAATVAAHGRRCFVAPSLEKALLRARSLDNPLLAGELSGIMPAGFDLNNSPSALDYEGELSRPLVLLSSSGTRLMFDAGQGQAGYAGCFRNYAALADHLANTHSAVALLGAATRGEFREEDQMCCAWIAEALICVGYRPGDRNTVEIVERWRNASPDACLNGNSAAYLRRSGQINDLDFVLNHINDLDTVLRIVKDEIVTMPQRSFLTKSLFKEVGAKASTYVPA